MSARRGDKTSEPDEKDEDEVHSLQYKIILLGDGAVGKVGMSLSIHLSRHSLFMYSLTPMLYLCFNVALWKLQSITAYSELNVSNFYLLIYLMSTDD